MWSSSVILIPARAANCMGLLDTTIVVIWASLVCMNLNPIMSACNLFGPVWFA